MGWGGGGANVSVRLKRSFRHNHFFQSGKREAAGTLLKKYWLRLYEWFNV